MAKKNHHHVAAIQRGLWDRASKLGHKNSGIRGALGPSMPSAKLGHHAFHVHRQMEFTSLNFEKHRCTKAKLEQPALCVN